MGGDLEIHVLGGSEGESIVIRCPDGHWGVIDCFDPKLTAADLNPTAEFLQTRNVKKLRFAGVTHPHGDHYRGMAEVVKQFNPDSFWIAGAMTPPDILKLLAHFENSAVGDAAASHLASDLAKDIPNYVQLIDLVRERFHNRAMQLEVLVGLTHLYPRPFDESAPFSIRGLGPFQELIDEYQQSILMWSDGNGGLKAKSPEVDHNLISPALLIKYGRVSVILGGDVELEGWKRIIAEHVFAESDVYVIKSGHHGSLNGNPLAFLDILRTKCGGRLTGIVTAFRKQFLPRIEGVERLYNHTHQLFTTSGEALILPPTDRFRFSQDTPLEARNAIHVAFQAWRKAKPAARGICSVFISKEGKVDCRVSGAAKEIERADSGQLRATP